MPPRIEDKSTWFFDEKTNKKCVEVTLDFETYYAPKYSLTNLSTSEYIRDERFKIHCLVATIADPNANTNECFICKTHEECTNFFKYLNSFYGAKNIVMIGHNLYFDGFICSEIFGFVPGLYLDTMCMSRIIYGDTVRHDLKSVCSRSDVITKTRSEALVKTQGKLELTDEEMDNLIQYCKEDVITTEILSQKLLDKFAGSPKEDEIILIDTTVRMFCRPVLEVNVELASEAIEEEKQRRQSLLEKTGLSLADIRSRQKFANALVNLGVDPPLKISPANGKETYAFSKTDEEFTDLLNHPNEDVRELVEARLANQSSILLTRAERLIKAGSTGSCKLPVLLNYAKAHTHRWSGGNKLNLQNLPRKGKLRKSIKAPQGHAIVYADLGQIEARVLAWLANCKPLLESFKKGECIYSRTATAIFDKPYEQILDERGDERQIGKVAALGLGYGMGAAAYQRTCKVMTGIEIPFTTAQTVVNTYRWMYNEIPTLWQAGENLIVTMFNNKLKKRQHQGLPIHGIEPLMVFNDKVLFPNGTVISYPDLQNEGTGITYQALNCRKKIYGGKIIENFVQKLARDIIANHMVKITLAGLNIVTMSHDEVVCVVKESHADAALSTMLDIMTTPPEWCSDLPLTADGEWAYAYSK